MQEAGGGGVVAGLLSRLRAASRRDGFVVAALLAFLLLYLSPFVLPNRALFKIGNDFQVLYANYATYSVDSIRSGFLPWWNPNEACGYPFYSNPFTAFFYPGQILYHILSAGSPLYSWYHHQLYMVLGVCLLGAGLYLWLRGRGVDRGAALFAAGAIAIGFRIADIYRFPNAVHAAAWMPWVLYAYDRWLDRAIGRGFLLGLLALFCLATAGYPYYTVYAAVLTGSYVLLRVAEGVPLRRAVIAIATLTAPVVFLVAPYYRSMALLLAQTVDRTGGNYDYVTKHSWSYTDLLGGLIFPPSAMSEGWLYCGLLPLLMVFVWIAIARPAGKAFLWIIALTFIVQLIAAGNGSFLFPAFWTFGPGIGMLRIWPRLTVILLPALALLIALAYEGLAATRVPPRMLQRRIWSIALVVAAVQIVLWITKTFSAYYEHYFIKMMKPAPFVAATFVAAIFCCIWLSYRTRLAWAVVALLVTASDTGMYGRQFWRESVGIAIPSEPLDLPGYYRDFFTTVRKPTIGMSVPYAPASGLMENWFYERYARFVEQYRGKTGFAELTGSRGRKIFFSPTLDSKPEHFEQWWRTLGAFETAAGASAVPMGTYNGNALRLSYTTAEPGYLIFVDNWDPYWRATVNGAAAPLVRSFDTFKAVLVPAGSGTVTFTYVPRIPYWGISIIGVVLAAGVVVFERRRRQSTEASVTQAADDAPRESAPHPPAAPSPHRDEAATGRRLPNGESREIVD
jgi:hypothetical protein